MKIKPRHGVSLVEVATVVAISAFVVSLFSPLILQGRQKMRQAECANNMRWIGQSCLQHEQALGYLPSSGWGWRWTGDPDRGFGRNQPGGWAFDAVRFTEFSATANLGAGLPDSEKAVGMQLAHSTPIPQFYCPERRPVRVYPVTRNGFLANNLAECRAGECTVLRIDYQANSGNLASSETAGQAGNRSTLNPGRLDNRIAKSNGVTTAQSTTQFRQITDGLSKTMLVGEKYLNANNYLNGNDPGDDNSAYQGLNRDINGYTASAVRQQDGSFFRVDEYVPRRDKIGLGLNWTFGSAHESGLNVVNCDGSVRFLTFDIDHVVFYRMGGRADGNAVP